VIRQRCSGDSRFQFAQPGPARTAQLRERRAGLFFCRFRFNSSAGRTTAEKDFARIELRERERALARPFTAGLKPCPPGLSPALFDLRSSAAEAPFMLCTWGTNKFVP